ncbi:hypothetical protein JCM17823_02160 [Halorubrum gandharaense]
MALSRVDNRSKAVAVVATLLAFGAGHVAVGEVQFVSIAAVAVGIGARFGSLWLGVRLVEAADPTALRTHDTAGGYHHGAAGVGLFATGVVALVARWLSAEPATAGSVAAVTAVVGYLVVSRLLPA